MKYVLDNNLGGCGVIARKATAKPSKSVGHARKSEQNGDLPKFSAPLNRVNVIIWLSAREAARKLSTSHDTINRRGVPWQPFPIRYRMRFKFMVLDEGGEPEKRYYEPDVEAMLLEPDQLPKASQRRLVPRFFRKPIPT
jgi:hypothetical protein